MTLLSDGPPCERDRAVDSLIPAHVGDPTSDLRKGRGDDRAASPWSTGDARTNNIETDMTMAAGRKKTAPKRGATNARRGRTPSKLAQPKAKTAPTAQRTTPPRKVAQKAARGRTQTKRVPSNRTVAQIDAVLTAQFEAMAQELGQIRELSTELNDLRMLVEALTGMVERLLANQRAQDGGPEPKVTSEEHRASAADADEPDTADDQRVPETTDSTPPPAAPP